MIIIANWYFALDYILSWIASFKVTPIVCRDYMKQLGWVGLTLTVPLITNPDSQRLLFWLYTWWLYVQFSPKKRRCYLFKEALKWLVLFLEVVRFYNINHFLFSNIFSSGFCFGSTHCDFTCNFHLKTKVLTLQGGSKMIIFISWGGKVLQYKSFFV